LERGCGSVLERKKIAGCRNSLNPETLAHGRQFLWSSVCFHPDPPIGGFAVCHPKGTGFSRNTLKKRLFTNAGFRLKRKTADYSISYLNHASMEV